MSLSEKVKQVSPDGEGQSPRLTRRSTIGLIRMQSQLKEIPLKTATSISTGLHVVLPVLLVGLTLLIMFLISWLLHFNFMDWFKPKDQPKDIEFVLVDDNHAKKPEKAKFKGEFNQEAGGKHDPKKPVEALSKPSAAADPQEEQPEPQKQAQPTPPAKQPPQPQKQTVAQKPQPEKPVEKPQEKPPEKLAEKTPEPPKPPVKQPTKVKTPTEPFTPTIPMPMVSDLKGPAIPKALTPQGPIAASTSSSSSNSGPVSLPASGTALAQTSGRPSQASAASAAGGHSGNPEEGPGKKPGVSVREADFGPYMSELKRRLTRNWHPPRGELTKRVVLKFEIARDGRLLSMEVNRTSGEPLADEAAMNAVKLSAPFRQLPPEFQGESVPVLFTFDYTVYGGGGTPKFQQVTR